MICDSWGHDWGAWLPQMFWTINKHKVKVGWRWMRQRTIQGEYRRCRRCGMEEWR